MLHREGKTSQPKLQALSSGNELHLGIMPGVSVDTAAPIGTPENPSDRIFTLANSITFVRLLLIPLFMGLLISDPIQNRIPACVVFGLAAGTDWVDGRVARSTQTVSRLGKALDPLIDRFLLAMGVFSLWLIGDVPLWILIFLVGRDVLLTCVFLITNRHKTRSINVSFTGKATTFMLLVGFGLLLLDIFVTSGLGLFDSPVLPGWGSEPVSGGIWFVYVGMVLSAVSAGQYIARAINYRHEIR